MKFIKKDVLSLERGLNDLDKLVIKFIDVLEKHVDYVIVSGYVSILLGRARATEDIDVYIKPMDKINFSILYNDLKKKGFWCLNAEDVNEVFSYLKEKLAVRFAEKGKAIPNFEVRFPKKPLDFDSFNDRITVKTKNKGIKISSLERQIAFKRYYLGTDKDLEDARHIESLFGNRLNNDLIEKYKKEIESLKRERC